MRRRELLIAAGLAASCVPASAALRAGAPAPEFAADGSLAGRPMRFRLSEALARGPVVLYFYPAAFTPGCTVEAHLFAEATPSFAELGATVVGVSVDDLDTLHRFSVSECRSRFAVLSDADRRITQAYDAAMPRRQDIAARVSYVIAPGARVLHAYASPSPERHVHETLEAVRRWRALHPAGSGSSR